MHSEWGKDDNMQIPIKLKKCHPHKCSVQLSVTSPMSCCAWHNRIVYKNVWKNTGMAAYGVLLILY